MVWGYMFMIIYGKRQNAKVWFSLNLSQRTLVPQAESFEFRKLVATMQNTNRKFSEKSTIQQFYFKSYQDLFGEVSSNWVQFIASLVNGYLLKIRLVKKYRFYRFAVNFWMYGTDRWINFQPLNIIVHCCILFLLILRYFLFSKKEICGAKKESTINISLC